MRSFILTLPGSHEKGLEILSCLSLAAAIALISASSIALPPLRCALLGSLMFCLYAIRAALRALDSPWSITFGCRRSATLRYVSRLIFRILSDMGALHLLRGLLLPSPFGVSPTQRILIAAELAKSISYVQTFNFVHRNVRPESILYFEDSAKRRSHTFLVGFDAFRAADGNTQLHGDFAWERNLYRHPLRQGEYPAEKYSMQHDIYALGVCLLEIGLWESFVEYVSDGQAVQTVTGSWYHDFQARMGSWEQIPSHLIPWKVKDYLVEVARSKLPVLMGDKYAKVVVDCLTCLDGYSGAVAQESSQDSGSEDVMAIAVRYVEETVFRLRDISV